MNRPHQVKANAVALGIAANLMKKIALRLSAAELELCRQALPTTTPRFRLCLSDYESHEGLFEDAWAEMYEFCEFEDANEYHVEIYRKAWAGALALFRVTHPGENT